MDSFFIWLIVFVLFMIAAIVIIIVFACQSSDNSTEISASNLQSNNFSHTSMLLEQLIDNTRTDKNTVHSYLQTYESLFHPIQLQVKNVLEIGIAGGGSIKLWYDYFQNAQIYAVDIMPKEEIWSELFQHSRIHLNPSTNAYSTSFVSHFKQSSLDIIIDDGPHSLESMKEFIHLYLPLLSYNGILIIEDIQSIDWIPQLTNEVPANMKSFIQVKDLRNNKNRYDDILFIIHRP